MNFEVERLHAAGARFDAATGCWMHGTRNLGKDTRQAARALFTRQLHGAELATLKAAIARERDANGLLRRLVEKVERR